MVLPKLWRDRDIKKKQPWHKKEKAQTKKAKRK
jgi:hypothetical protein